MTAGKFYRKNFKTFSVDNFSDPFTSGGMCIYEVVRTDDGIPLFLEDHIERLTKSFEIAGKIPLPDPEVVKNEILFLSEINGIKDGLIRIVHCFTDNGSDIYLFNNKVNFPSVNDYETGVACELMSAERHDPEAKIYIPSVREKANNIIQGHKVYETILVNAENRITEGSRSNVFFIKDNTVVTAPDDAVLHGITRKKVLEIIDKLSIPLKYDLLRVDDLEATESVFLTGTTPKVLPVRSINGHTFDTSNELIFKILNEYNRIIQEYKMNFR